MDSPGTPIYLNQLRAAPRKRFRDRINKEEALAPLRHLEDRFIIVGYESEPHYDGLWRRKKAFNE